MRYDLVPEVATEYPSVSRDGKTYTFTIRSGSPQIKSGDAITLQSSAGNYIVAEDGGGNLCDCDSHVKANRSIAREWETFILSLH